MSLTDRERHDAYEALTHAFGDQTDAVIQLLRTDQTHLVTRDDLAVTTAELRSDMAELRSEMAGLRTELTSEMAGLRTELTTEMANLRSELTTQMANLRSDLTTEIAGLRGEFVTRIDSAIASQTRQMMITIFVAVALIALTNALRVPGT